MPTISWNDSTKTWSWSGFSVKTNNGYDDEGSWYSDQWGYAIKKRLIGETTWTQVIDHGAHISSGTFSLDVTSYPAQHPQTGYEYQGYRLNTTGFDSSQSLSYTEPSDIFTLGGGVTPLAITLNPVDALSETTAIATVLGGVTIHTISGATDCLSETTVLLTTIGNSTLIIGTVNALSDTTVIAEVITSILPIAGKADALAETTVLIDIMPILNLLGTVDAIASVSSQVDIIYNLNFYLTGIATINGVATPNIDILAVKIDKSRTYSSLSNTDGSFSVNVDEGSYHILGVYDDGNGNKYASLITPYVEVA